MNNFYIERNQKLSYIKARDPSIITYGQTYQERPRCNLQDHYDISEREEESEMNDRVEVYLRIKRCDDTDIYECTNNSVCCHVPSDSQIAKNKRDDMELNKIYTFTKVFPPTTDQLDLFNCIVKPKMLNLINGINSNLLCYGVSGAGKTFTMIGTGDEPGIIPRSLEYLFRTLPPLADTPSIKPTNTGSNANVKWLNTCDSNSERHFLNKLLSNSRNMIETNVHLETYRKMQQRLSVETVAEADFYEDVALAVWVSFAEIYNEQVFDLLDENIVINKPRERLRICNNNKYTYIKKLKQVYVSSGNEAYQVLQYGLHNLKYASTSVNSHSSRSHCIFTVTLAQAKISEDDAYISQINFCDLAGSERSKKTHNVGDRLRESNNINNSLMVLGKCIKIVRDLQKINDKSSIVPFRESKLTQLFQLALSGLEDIAMIVNINPIHNMFDESMHTLNFSAIAQEIQYVKKEMRLKRTDSNGTELNSCDSIIRRELDAKDFEIERLEETVRQLRHNLKYQHENKLQEEELMRKTMMSDFQEIVQNRGNKIKFLEEENRRYKRELQTANRRILDLEDELSAYREKYGYNDDSILSIPDSPNTSHVAVKNKILEEDNLMLETKVISLEDQIFQLKAHNESLHECRKSLYQQVAEMDSSEDDSSDRNTSDEIKDTSDTT